MSGNDLGTPIDKDPRFQLRRDFVVLDRHITALQKEIEHVSYYEEKFSTLNKNPFANHKEIITAAREVYKNENATYDSLKMAFESSHESYRQVRQKKFLPAFSDKNRPSTLAINESIEATQGSKNAYLMSRVISKSDPMIKGLYSIVKSDDRHHERGKMLDKLADSDEHMQKYAFEERRWTNPGAKERLELFKYKLDEHYTNNDREEELRVRLDDMAKVLDEAKEHGAKLPERKAVYEQRGRQEQEYDASSVLGDVSSVHSKGSGGSDRPLLSSDTVLPDIVLPRTDLPRTPKPFIRSSEVFSEVPVNQRALGGTTASNFWSPGDGPGTSTGNRIAPSSEVPKRRASPTMK